MYLLILFFIFIQRYHHLLCCFDYCFRNFFRKKNLDKKSFKKIENYMCIYMDTL